MQLLLWSRITGLRIEGRGNQPTPPTFSKVESGTEAVWKQRIHTSLETLVQLPGHTTSYTFR